MRKIYVLAAIVIAAGACSVQENPVQENPVQEEIRVQENKIYTLVTTLESKADAEVKSVMTDHGTTLSTEWEAGDKIWVNYDDTGDNNVVAMGTVSAVDGDGKATVTVDLVNPKDASTIVFGFPYDHWTEAKDVRIDQLGTLTDINANHAAISGSGVLTVSGSDVTLPGNVSMYQEMAIWKLKFKDGSTDITDQITSLNISFGPYDDYMITPTAQSNIYVALYPVDDGDITISASTATGIYSFSKSGVTLENGKYYRSTVSLSAAAANETYRVFTSRSNYSDEPIPAGATTVTGGTVAWANGTYVVSGNVVINSAVTVTGNVNLILKDGASLTVNNTITGECLNIYGQALSSGRLNVVYSDINVSVESLAIHGGVITVTEGGVMQGLESYESLDIYHGTVTTAGEVNGFMVMGDMHVYGGNVTCSATNGSALSIYGAGAHDGSLTVSGGTFTVTAAGVGNYGIQATDGYGEGTASIVFSGGTIAVSGGDSDDVTPGGIAIDVCGSLTISGNADVTANGGTDAFNQGGGYGINVYAGSSAGGNVMISGGRVTATSGPGGLAAINVDNDLTISGATTQIEATGGEMGEGILASGIITINGGIITATAGENGIGLEGTATITGGTVTAIGGDAVAGSDGDGSAGFDGLLTMTGGKLIATGGAKDGAGSDGHGISDGSTIDLTGVTMYEGDGPDPSSAAASQTACTKRYVIIR